MSDEYSKIKNSSRRHKDENAVKKQLKIAKSHHVGNPIYDDQPHRLAKKHAMNCGDPRCFMCGNPRKFFGDLTIQERRMFQDIDTVSDRKGNGLERDK